MNDEVEKKAEESEEVLEIPRTIHPAPVTDLSQRSVSLGRIVDRLKRGCTYNIQLVKPVSKSQRWTLIISSDTDKDFEPIISEL